MRLSLVALAMCVGLVEVPALEIAPAPSTIQSKGEPFDIVYLSDTRPVVVRLHILQEGKSLEQAWSHFADLFFAKLDTDKNGILSEKELSRLRPMMLFLTSQNARTPSDLAPSEKSMTRKQFGEYLKKNDMGPIRMPNNVIQQQQRVNRIRRGGAPSTEELDKALLELLDTNKDGKISVEEFKAGIEILSKLDADENELVSVEEVMRRPQSPYFVQVEEGGGPMRVISPGVELYPLVRKGMDKNLANRMLVRYGPKAAVPAATTTKGPIAPPAPGSRVNAPTQEPMAKVLKKNEINLSDIAFAAIDQDGNDELDKDELSRFGENARAEVEIALRIGKVVNGTRAASVLHSGESPVKAYAGPFDHEVTIEVPGVRLDLMVRPVFDAKNLTSNFRTGYLNRFRNADRDGNGYLDANEVNFDPVFRDIFNYLDRDGDGKIFEKELVAAIDEVEDLVYAGATGIATLDLAEAGRGLFGLIDTNGDGKLSIPELRAMPKLVERFAANKTEGLAPSEVPRRFECSMTMGVSMVRNAFAVRGFDGMGGPGRPQAQQGPIWFQKMDRNRDGYVSRREFLGTDEEFKMLDLDGDGFISLEEAMAAEKKFEKK